MKGYVAVVVALLLAIVAFVALQQAKLVEHFAGGYYRRGSLPLAQSTPSSPATPSSPSSLSFNPPGLRQTDNESAAPAPSLEYAPWLIASSEGVCEPPDGVPSRCCLGSSSAGGGVGWGKRECDWRPLIDVPFFLMLTRTCVYSRSTQLCTCGLLLPGSRSPF